MTDDDPFIRSFTFADIPLLLTQSASPVEKALHDSGVDHRFCSVFCLSDGSPIPEARGLLHFFQQEIPGLGTENPWVKLHHCEGNKI